MAWRVMPSSVQSSLTLVSGLPIDAIARRSSDGGYLYGRPPRARAEASPVMVRSEMSSRSNSATPAKSRRPASRKRSWRRWPPPGRRRTFSPRLPAVITAIARPDERLAVDHAPGGRAPQGQQPGQGATGSGLCPDRAQRHGLSPRPLQIPESRPTWADQEPPGSRSGPDSVHGFGHFQGGRAEVRRPES